MRLARSWGCNTVVVRGTKIEDEKLRREAADIEARRAALRDLTPPLRVALERLGPLPGDEAVGVFHCTMAFEDGADWLQRGDTTANPYYGDRMLRCGDRVRGLQER